MRAALPAVIATLLIAAVAFFGHSFDLQISDLAFDFSTSTWLVDHQSGPLRFILYDGPTRMLELFGLLLLAIVVLHRRLKIRPKTRNEALFLLLCLIAVPSVTGAVKSASGVSCPYALQHYGGLMADSYGRFSLAGFVDPKRTDGCWPSGHVSGAFALLGFLCLPMPGRRLLAVAATISGTAMGAYQVLRGAHFASHIFVTFCIATIVVTLLQQMVLPRVTEVGRHGDGRALARATRKVPG